MKEIKLTKIDARKLVTASQYHLNKHRFTEGTEGTYQTIQHLGYVQIDTISVVERAHHHTIWNRHHSYSPQHINTLQENQRRIFEYWAHAAAYLPMENYRFCLPRMKRIRNNGTHWFPRDKHMIRRVLDIIKNEGPKQAKDFKTPNHKSEPWWGWKPTKIALEYLFMEGRLMVTKRKGFQKIYDLAENVIPEGTNTRMPTPTQMAGFLIESGLRSLGLISVKDIVYQRKDGVERVKTVFERKRKKKEILAVRIEGVNDLYYTTPELLGVLDMKTPVYLRFLSPFDNLVIRRQRVVELFDFSYQLECYVPVGKRKRGYFSLPILYRDGLVGTMDAKAHRKEGVFSIRNFHLDNKPVDEGDFLECFQRELRVFMGFNKCTELEIEFRHPEFEALFPK